MKKYSYLGTHRVFFSSKVLEVKYILFSVELIQFPHQLEFSADLRTLDALLQLMKHIFIESQNHRTGFNPRIIKWVWLEETFKGHLDHHLHHEQDIFNQIKLLKPPSNMIFKVSRHGTFTTFPLGNLFGCFSTIIIIIFFLIFNLK